MRISIVASVLAGTLLAVASPACAQSTNWIDALLALVPSPAQSRATEVQLDNVDVVIWEYGIIPTRSERAQLRELLGADLAVYGEGFARALDDVRRLRDEIAAQDALRYIRAWVAHNDRLYQGRPRVESLRYAHDALANWPASRRYCPRSEIDLTKVPALTPQTFRCGGYDVRVSAIHLRGQLRSASIQISPTDTPEDNIEVPLSALSRQPTVVRNNRGEAPVAMAFDGRNLHVTIAPPQQIVVEDLSDRIVGRWALTNPVRGAASWLMTRVFGTDGSYELFTPFSHRTGRYQVDGNTLTLWYADGQREQVECEIRFRSGRLAIRNCSGSEEKDEKLYWKE